MASPINSIILYVHCSLCRYCSSFIVVVVVVVVLRLVNVL